MKKIPMRQCVVTREKLPKKELIRIVKTEDGVIADLTGKVNGHGCYIKNDIEVLNLAKKNKILDKVLETEITEEVYKTIEEIINK
jgi:hypothetical protein